MQMFSDTSSIGGCNFNGENCTLLETTLINPSCAGCGSSSDISLIKPSVFLKASARAVFKHILFNSHAFSVATGFRYDKGCAGSGANCKWIRQSSETYLFIHIPLNQGGSPNCPSAFRESTDTYVQVACKNCPSEFPRSGTEYCRSFLRRPRNQRQPCYYLLYVGTLDVIW